MPKRKPTIEELEKILQEPDRLVRIAPNGEVYVGMTAAELTANLLTRMREVDAIVAERTRERPFGIEDYRLLWHGVSHELALAQDDE